MSGETKSDYLAMQKNFYDGSDRDADHIVGNYTFHENFPYETQLLHVNGDVRKPVFEDFSGKKAFDIACGEGRMIRRMEKVFGAGCDGADISEKMVVAARERCPNSDVFQSSGNDCGPAPSDTYDFAFCTISLQHIASHSVRTDIIRDLRRILKPDGKITLQFIMAKHYPFFLRDQLTGRHELVREYVRSKRHAGYFDDRFDAEGSNGRFDNVIGMRDIPRVLEDFKQHFRDAQVWFHDISLGRNMPDLYDRVLDPSHPNSHLTDTYHATHYVFLHGERPIK